jgi:hypothetical protein
MFLRRALFLGDIDAATCQDLLPFAVGQGKPTMQPHPATRDLARLTKPLLKGRFIVDDPQDTFLK